MHSFRCRPVLSQVETVLEEISFFLAVAALDSRDCTRLCLVEDLFLLLLLAVSRAVALLACTTSYSTSSSPFDTISSEGKRITRRSAKVAQLALWMFLKVRKDCLFKLKKWFSSIAVAIPVSY